MGNYFGDKVQKILNSSNAALIAIAGEVTVYTKAVRVNFGETFALNYKFTSDGTVNVKMEIEISEDPPTTEGSADLNYVIGDGESTWDTITGELKHTKALTLQRCRYWRFKLTGLTGNHSSTTLAASLTVGF